MKMVVVNLNIWCERGAYVSKKSRKKLEGFNPLKIKRIGVIRQAALGDMVITRAVLIELKKFFPNAKITFSMVDNYLYGKPDDLYDDEHIVCRKKGILKKIKSLKFKETQDIIFDFANTSSSRQICFLNKAFLKIGFPYRAIEQKLFYDICIFRSDFHFEGDIMFDALKILGHKPEYPLNYGLVNFNRCEDKIVYFFGASTETKQYPKKMYYELIWRLCEKYKNYEHILLEGVNPNEKFDDIPENLNNKSNITIKSKLDLNDLISFLSKCRLCVSPDTGVRNVAIAVHTPTVGIFYSTVPYRYWPRYENGHDAAFNRSGEIPSVSEVEKIVIKNLSMEIIR